ncbi:MAG: guanylate kinase [bacterium]
MDLLQSLQSRPCSILFIISAPSGAGKSSICRKIKQKRENQNCDYSISYTTRAPRRGEMEGEDYYFISESRFKEMIKNNEFAEWELVHDNFYGTPKSEIAKAFTIHHDLLLDIDVKGAGKLRKLYPDAVYIYIFPPSFSELKARLEKRMTESSEQVKKRFSNAIVELSYFVDYDYFVFNDDLEIAVNKINAIIEIEKNRISRIPNRMDIKSQIMNLSM